MARLEDLRTNNLKLTGLMEGASSGPTPALVWLSYNVHGNESVSTEAALATLYDLADSNNARTQAWLVNTVVILDPCINPDGRDRYVAFYNRTVGRFSNVAPDAREHHEPWPGGRTNHYYFDLNRDWAWATQLETQQRLALYHRWMPHIHVDFHEQGVRRTISPRRQSRITKLSPPGSVNSRRSSGATMRATSTKTPGSILRARSSTSSIPATATPGRRSTVPS